MYDLAIVGGGPAGLSAAIHAKRFGLDFILIEKNELGGQALSANLIENYPGFPNGISGSGLMKRFVEQVLEKGVKIEKDEVMKIKPAFYGNDGFTIKTSAAFFNAHSIILATGLVPKRLPFEMNRKVHYYPDPSKLEHEGKDVLVIGGGDSAFDEAVSFSKKAGGVTIVMRSNEPRALKRLVNRAKKAGVVIKTGLKENDIEKMTADIVIGCVGKERDLNIIDKSLLVTIHDSRFTHLAGDAAHPKIRHVAVAVGDGVTAVERLYGNSF